MTAKKFLVVDDDVTLATLLKEKLEESGGQVRLSHDGGHAAGLVRNETYDAIILDVKIPSMNGLQVAAIAKSSPQNRGAIMYLITGSSEQDTLDRAQKIGIKKVFTKPFDPTDFVKEVVNDMEVKAKPLRYDARVINTFVEAAKEVMTFYFNKPPKLGKPAVRADNSPSRGYVTGLISLTGENFVGSMALSCDAPFLKILAEAVFPGGDIKMEPAIIGDLTGEMCNQVLGKVKINLGRIGVKIIIGLPEVVMGRGHKIIHKVHNPVIFIPVGYDNAWSELEFCLDQRDITIDETKAEDPTVKDVMLWD